MKRNTDLYQGYGLRSVNYRSKKLLLMQQLTTDLEFNTKL